MDKETRFKNAGKIGDAIGLTRYILHSRSGYNPDNTDDKLKELIEILDSIEV